MTGDPDLILTDNSASDGRLAFCKMSQTGLIVSNSVGVRFTGTTLNVGCELKLIGYTSPATNTQIGATHTITTGANEHSVVLDAVYDQIWWEIEKRVATTGTNNLDAFEFYRSFQEIRQATGALSSANFCNAEYSVANMDAKFYGLASEKTGNVNGASVTTLYKKPDKQQVDIKTTGVPYNYDFYKYVKTGLGYSILNSLEFTFDNSNYVTLKVLFDDNYVAPPP